MFVDRLTNLAIINGKIENEDMGRLDVFFDENDLQALADPSRAYTMDRFMGCTEEGMLQGWQPEDKIHVRLERPLQPADDEKVAELRLDNGGDLYFTIWNSTALRDYQPIDFAALPPFVTSDPNNKLGNAGIKAVCIHQLVDLAQRL